MESQFRPGSDKVKTGGKGGLTGKTPVEPAARQVNRSTLPVGVGWEPSLFRMLKLQFQ